MSLQRITCEDASGDPIQHVCDPCEREHGRVRGVVLFDAAYNVEALIAKLTSGTPSDVEAAEQLFTAAVENGDAFLIPETTGTYDGGSPQTGDGYGDDDDTLLGYLYTLNFMDPSYAGNQKFWQQAERRHWRIAWRTETLLHFTDKPARVQAIDPVEQDLTSAVVWNTTATWKSKDKPAIAPIGPLAKYFEGCWENSESNG